MRAQEDRRAVRIAQFTYVLAYKASHVSHSLKYIFFFNVLGGFYSDTEAFVNESCLRCPNGTFVSENDAPGRRARDCRACPQGSTVILLQCLF